MAGLTISLTSVPPRFVGLGAVCSSLVDQGVDRVVLFIPNAYARFPAWDGTLPIVPDGVEVMRTRDHGPATKLIPALDLLAPDAPVLICDDDCIYAPGWAAGFLAAGADNPGAAIAGSAYQVARLGLVPKPDASHLIVQGFAGVLVAPGMLAQVPVPPAARYVDDIWLSAALAASGTQIVCPQGLRALVSPRAGESGALQDETFDGLGRAQLNARAAEAFRRDLGIWD